MKVRFTITVALAVIFFIEEGDGKTVKNLRKQDPYSRGLHVPVDSKTFDTGRVSAAGPRPKGP